MSSGATLPTLMAREAAEAPQAVARLLVANQDACRALGERLRRAPPRFVVTCARGSSDSAATYAKYLIEIALGIVVASVGPSISSIYGGRPKMRDALFLAISQSGRSPDLLTLAEAARADGALTVALVNDTARRSPSSARSSCRSTPGPERSVAATKSYIASLAGVLHLVRHWSGDAALDRALQRLPADLARGRGRRLAAACRRCSTAASLYVVGRGPGFGAALEAALKLKETCGLHAEALSAAELMHGPMALAAPDFPRVPLQPARPGARRARRARRARSPAAASR